ncbi:hypothetical protein L6164_020057 [Bauhinia variegata]|uniref:Uncharacterized protein n=1 Tax=Bauhinia variegata TaxID=167791 RepID=A0ACB9MV68_BAUVA|nr:hypothetical protein L6164_020057 [Bauhinia variegata]
MIDQNLRCSFILMLTVRPSNFLKNINAHTLRSIISTQEKAYSDETTLVSSRFYETVVTFLFLTLRFRNLKPKGFLDHRFLSLLRI